ncbi:ribokinase [Salinisphaera sp. SPP-AMP-43]|uniref:ribokinase n=1 Tax=Salinisphaera sp. SPP-AMP-43 TaxID=3121288 RepID=UPI003C6E24E4
MIVVAGSANIDLVARVAHQPAPGETLIADDYAVHQGGKGANQAVAATRLGTPVRFIGAIGNDDFGRQILAGLTAEHIDTHSVSEVTGSSGLALITVDTAGENSIVVVPGANGQLTADAPALDTGFDGARVALVQLETPPSFVDAALASARVHGAEVVLNAAPAAPLEQFDMTNVDWLMVNAGEAAFVLGEAEGHSRAETEAHAATLVERYGVGVIVTLGGDGALWTEPNGDGGHVPGRTCDVVDTTGAGDTFAGAFAHARAENLSIRAAIETAVVAGALSVGRAGARAGMPTQAELAAAIAE